MQEKQAGGVVRNGFLGEEAFGMNLGRMDKILVGGDEERGRN